MTFLKYGIRSLVVVAVVMLALTVGTAVQAQDAPTLMIPILENGASFTDEFTGMTGTRLYAFNGSAGDVVTISMTQITEGLDPFLVLLGPAGELIAMDDDSGTGATYAAQINGVVLPESGGYFIVASSFENIDAILETELTSAQSYTVTLNGITPPTSLPDFNPDLVTYYRGELAYNTPINAASTVVEPVYYFVFNGAAGQTVSLTMTSTQFDTILHLFDSNGNRIAVNNGDTFDSAINQVTLPADGQYLVFATDVFFYSAGDANAQLPYTGGDFTITLSGDAAAVPPPSSSGTKPTNDGLGQPTPETPASTGSK